MKETVSNPSLDDPLETNNSDGVSSLLAKLNAYLKSCHFPNEDNSKKRTDGFPNLAGFCRYLGCGISALDELRRTEPTLYDHICAILEDEALNAEVSPTVLTAYLKKRLGYSEHSTERADTDCGEFRLIFEHDVLEDGS